MNKIGVDMVCVLWYDIPGDSPEGVKEGDGAEIVPRFCSVSSQRV